MPRKDTDDELMHSDAEIENEGAEKKVDYTEDPVIWQQRFDLAYNNQKTMFTKFGEWYEQMYAIKNYKNIAIWKSKLFVPIMAYKSWTVIAKLLAMRPGFSVKMYDKTYSNEDRKRIEKANLKLEYDYDNPMEDETIRDKMFDCLTDAVVTGTGVAKVPWTTGIRKKYSHFTNDDGTIDYTKRNVEETEFGYNDLEPMDIFDFFPAPGKRNIEKKPWLILKFPGKTRAELIQSGLYDEKVINDLKPVGKSRDFISKLKQSRDNLIGRTQDDQDSIDETVDKFDLFECLERTSDGCVHLCVFVEASNTEGEGQNSDGDSESNWKRLRSEKQIEWHNKYPVQTFYIRRKPHQAWGESIFQITESMANGYNDIVNQLADNLNIVGNGGILMHDTSTVIYDFYYAPGGEIRYSGNKPEFETPQSPDLNIFTTMLNLLESGISNATVSPYASGTPSDATDKTQGTASGIAKLQEASGEIVTFMKSNFMQSLKGIGTRWLSNNRQFLDEDLMLETKKNGKNVPMKINREDFSEAMVLTIDEASMQPATKEERLNSKLAWLKAMFDIQDRSQLQVKATEADMTIVNKPKTILYNLEQIAREISDEFGVSDFDQYVYNDGDDSNMDNTNIVNAIRKQVESGDMDADQAQILLDQLERRENANGQQQTAPVTDAAGVAVDPASPPIQPPQAY